VGLDLSLLNLTSFNSAIAYCDLENRLISLMINAQRPVYDWIQVILAHFGGFMFWSEGTLNIRVLKEENYVQTITPSRLVSPNEDLDAPVIEVTKRRYTQTYNRIEVVWTNRESDYQSSVAVANDEVDQRISRQIRVKTVSLKGITNPIFASIMAYRYLIEAMYRFSSFTFTVSYNSMLLEVGDVVIIDDEDMINGVKARIMSIDETENSHNMEVTAIEDVTEVYPTLTPKMELTKYVAEGDYYPAHTEITPVENLESNSIDLSLTPATTDISGWYLYKSYDDINYISLGRTTAANHITGDTNISTTLRTRLLSAKSVTHRKDESFLISVPTLFSLPTGNSDADLFNGQRLIQIGDEIIAYKDAEETDVTGVWKVSNLIRGMHYTAPVAHTPGETVTTLNVDYSYMLEPSDYGQTIYFKAVPYYMDVVGDITAIDSYAIQVQNLANNPLPVSLMRIRGREGKDTYYDDNITIDWYMCSKTSGFGHGGYGTALWGSFQEPTNVLTFNVALLEEDDTEISNTTYTTTEIGSPPSMSLVDADRGGNNPYKIKITPGGVNASSQPREIQIEKL
jgi:hypothetical protein